VRKQRIHVNQSTRKPHETRWGETGSFPWRSRRSGVQAIAAATCSCKRARRPHTDTLGGGAGGSPWMGHASPHPAAGLAALLQEGSRRRQSSSRHQDTSWRTLAPSSLSAGLRRSRRTRQLTPSIPNPGDSLHRFQINQEQTSSSPFSITSIFTPQAPPIARPRIEDVPSTEPSRALGIRRGNPSNSAHLPPIQHLEWVAHLNLSLLVASA
jgi:hypothetical protein